MHSIIEWAAQAKHGDRIEYARGNLAALRYERTRLIKEEAPVPAGLDFMCDSANDAWNLHEAGDVVLTQHRYGDHDYSYLATRREAQGRTEQNVSRLPHAVRV